MRDDQIRFEVFGRRRPKSRWTLTLATADRAAAVSRAEALVGAEGYAAAKVCRQSLDPQTRLAVSDTVLSLGAPDPRRRRTRARDPEPACLDPQDLYTRDAGARIAEVLEPWLAQRRITAFELLHRADLAEQLEGDELLHAIQKVAVPEANARGCSVHGLIRAFQSLIERAMARLARDQGAGVLIRFTPESFASAAEQALGGAEPAYRLGAGVAGVLADAADWGEKLCRLIALADAAPAAEPARGFALSVLEQPLAEILADKEGLRALIGPGLDLGGRLAVLTRLAGGEAVERVILRDPSLRAMMPAMSEPAARLGRWLGGGDFLEVRAALGQRILAELNGPRRLRPDDAAGEIEILRGLAVALTAAAGALLPLEQVEAAFAARSQMLVTGEFVTALLGKGRPAVEEAQALVRLCENVVGAANKRRASRWLAGVVGGLAFEAACSARAAPLATRLRRLAELQRQVGRCGLADEDAGSIQAKLGALGGAAEAEERLVAKLGKADAPVVPRIVTLLRMAAGRTAPLGPAADRARAEARRLLRNPDARAALAGMREELPKVRSLLQEAGLAT